MNRTTKIALGVGGLAWGLSILLFPFFFLANLLALLVPAIVLYFAVLHGPVHHRAIQFAKVGVIFLVLEVSTLAFLVENPLLWPNQIARSYDKGLLLQPHAASIEELRDHFDAFVASEPFINETWHWATYYGPDVAQDRYLYGNYNLSKLDYKNLDNFERLLLVDYYIRNNTMNWTSDSEVYGVSDYKATPDEALKDKNYEDPMSRARDDCDGITVVTVSFLLNLNESGWIDCDPRIGSGYSHWYPVVYLPSNPQPIFLYYWRTVHAWVFYSADSIELGQPLVYTIADVVFDEDSAEMEMYVQYLVDNWGLTLLLGFAVAFGLVLVCKYPRHPKAPRASPPGDKGQELSQENGADQKTRTRTLRQKLQPFQRRYLWTWISVGVTFACLLGGVALYTLILTRAPTWNYVALWLMLGVLVAVLSRDGFARGIYSLKNWKNQTRS